MIWLERKTLPFFSKCGLDPGLDFLLAESVRRFDEVEDFPLIRRRIQAYGCL